MPTPRTHNRDEPKDDAQAGPSTHGGKRVGAGRPKGQGRYGEPTRPLRVPESLVPDVQDLLSLYRRHKERVKSASSRAADDAPPTVLHPVSLGPAQPLPLFGSRVSAGFPSPADDYLEDTLDLNSHLIKRPAATFLVRVSGDSMINAGIHPDDILVVDRSIDPTDGRIVIAVLDGELTVKRLSKRNGQVQLLPENPDFSPITVTEEQDLRIWGVVTNVIHSL